MVCASSGRWTPYVLSLLLTCVYAETVKDFISVCWQPRDLKQISLMLLQSLCEHAPLYQKVCVFVGYWFFHEQVLE
ncbi:hypothetical protein NDU88_012036 [Pleurodeles waltl]|uniref:Secreted protein n=1 Tax=Pleurodeles waltl TaxID=8319 RepID=A0AAV7QZ11_PLEWA|nr:hypothetical protein NDU88_012036 [Pleurodeles waltl]